MKETAVHIAAPPDRVYAEMIKDWEAAEPGPMKVGDHFQVAGQGTTFTVTLLEPPTRFGLSWVSEGNSYTAEYTVLPDAGGTQVRLGIDARSVKSPLTAWLVGALATGREETKMLQDLKDRVETGSPG
jgi:Polyketide cyclase / dehydrase and lipid transport